VLRDAHPDVLGPEAEAPDQHRADAPLLEPCAWDAWGDAHPGAMDAADLHPEPLGEGAEKLADPELAVRARDAWWFLPVLQSALQAQQAGAAELCTRDAVRSAEQSCAAQAVAAALRPWSGGAVLQVPAARPMLKPMAMRAQMAKRLKVERGQPQDAKAQLQVAQHE